MNISFFHSTPFHDPAYKGVLSFSLPLSLCASVWLKYRARRQQCLFVLLLSLFSNRFASWSQRDRRFYFISFSFLAPPIHRWVYTYPFAHVHVFLSLLCNTHASRPWNFFQSLSTGELAVRMRTKRLSASHWTRNRGSLILLSHVRLLLRSHFLAFPPLREEVKTRLRRSVRLASFIPFDKQQKVDLAHRSTYMSSLHCLSASLCKNANLLEW